MVNKRLDDIFRILDRLRDDLNSFECGDVPELDIVDYIEDLSDALGDLIIYSLDIADPTPLIDVVDYTSNIDDGEITSLIFNMITLQLNAIISVIGWAVERGIARDEAFREMRNEDFVNFSADTTVKSIEEGNIDTSLDISTSYLVLGFYSTVIGDEVGVDNAIDYFVYTGLKLDEGDIIKVLFKTHIYMSYLIINEVVRRDRLLIGNIEKYRLRKIRRTDVAKTFYSLIKSKYSYDLGKIDIEVRRKLAELIKKTINTKNDWSVLREVRSFNWLYRRYAEKYGWIIEDILYTLEGVIQAFSKSPDDINLSENILETGKLTDEDREIVALISSALKMYRLGLRDAYKNILEGMKKLSMDGRRIRLSRIADILRRIEEGV